MLLLIMKNIFPERQSGQALPRDPKIAENSKREAEAARRMIYRLINRNVPGYASNLVLHRRYQITKKKSPPEFGARERSGSRQRCTRYGELNYFRFQIRGTVWYAVPKKVI